MTTVTQIDRGIEQFEKLMQIARDNFSPERMERLEKMYEVYAERIVVAPASQKVHWHNCYPGGYLDHIHGVIAATVHVSRGLKALGAEIDFTREEVVFAAMHHDLGKLGTPEEPYYVPQLSDWHREKRGEYYTVNPNISYMSVTDRALEILQRFEVKMSEKEWKAIKLSDGLYDETNRKYYINYAYPPPPFDSNLYRVIHFADHFATISEHDRKRNYDRT